MPAYAECGGLMYLCRSLAWQGGRHETVGFVPGDAVMKERPLGRGDVRLRETGAAPWSGAKSAGRAFAAHDFHHATLENLPDGLTYAYAGERGHGIDGRRGGTRGRNTAANRWAERFVVFVRARGFRHGARD